MNNTNLLKELREEYLDYQDLCEFLSISYATARRWKSQRKLPFTMIGSKVLFPKKELYKILKTNTVKAVEQLAEETKPLISIGHNS